MISDTDSHIMDHEHSTHKINITYVETDIPELVLITNKCYICDVEILSLMDGMVILNV